MCRLLLCKTLSQIENRSNENLNGVIRQYYPKGSCFEGITKEQVQTVENKLNHSPKKGKLNYIMLHESCGEYRIRTDHLYAASVAL